MTELIDRVPKGSVLALSTNENVWFTVAVTVIWSLLTVPSAAVLVSMTAPKWSFVVTVTEFWVEAEDWVDSAALAVQLKQ